MTAGVATLEVYTWQGTAAWAIHYYGELHGPDGRSSGKIKRPLSKRDAIQLNKRLEFVYSKEYYNLYKVSPGAPDDRFDTKDQVIAHAKKVWKDKYPECNILIDHEDSSIVYDKRNP